MVFRSATRIILVLAATAAMAQGTPPGTTPAAPMLNTPLAPQLNQRPGLASRKSASAGNKYQDLQGVAALRQRVDDMEHTVTQMNLVLKQMRDKAAKAHTMDSLTKSNLSLWELMVGHLDKELQEMRVAVAAREDMEARRAALYKQADEKAAAQAQAARAAQAARFSEAEKYASGTATPAPSGQAAGQNPAGQTAPAQGTQAPAAPVPSAATAPASPATSSSSPN